MRLFAEDLPGILDAAMAILFLCDNSDQVLAVATGLLDFIALDRLEIYGASQTAKSEGSR